MMHLNRQIHGFPENPELAMAPDGHCHIAKMIEAVAPVNSSLRRLTRRYPTLPRSHALTLS
jgi:hypothetical protein